MQSRNQKGVEPEHGAERAPAHPFAGPSSLRPAGPSIGGLALAACLALVACGDGGEAPQPDRRASLRDQIRAELGERYDEPLPAVPEEALARGAEIWNRTCASCHGADGAGRTPMANMLAVPPGDLTDPERAGFFSEQAKVWIVAEGSPGTPMPGSAGALDDAEILAVVAHMATLVGG